MYVVSDDEKQSTIEDAIKNFADRSPLFFLPGFIHFLPLTDLDEERLKHYSKYIVNLLVSQVREILLRSCPLLLKKEKTPKCVAIAAARDFLLHLSDNQKVKIADDCFDHEWWNLDHHDDLTGEVLPESRYWKLISAIKQNRPLPEKDALDFPHIVLTKKLMANATPRLLETIEVLTWLNHSLSFVSKSLTEFNYFRNGNLQINLLPHTVRLLLPDSLLEKNRVPDRNKVQTNNHRAQVALAEAYEGWLKSPEGETTKNKKATYIKKYAWGIMKPFKIKKPTEKSFKKYLAKGYRKEKLTASRS